MRSVDQILLAKHNQGLRQDLYYWDFSEGVLFTQTVNTFEGCYKIEDPRFLLIGDIQHGSRKIKTVINTLADAQNYIRFLIEKDRSNWWITEELSGRLLAIVENGDITTHYFVSEDHMRIVERIDTGTEILVGKYEDTEKWSFSDVVKYLLAPQVEPGTRLTVLEDGWGGN